MLPRPPAENRIRLYGLYKQATEGNVEGIMTRPIGFSIEDEGAKKKWDAWKREEGLSKTEAKRRYISYLIETMKVYASGTLEARELLSELEYLWDQIKDVQFSPDEEAEHENEDLYNINYPQSLVFLHPGDQSDRLSTATPLPLGSNYSASVVPNQQYRNNLHKIYSHSRRSTMLSINDYINQQRQSNATSQAGPREDQFKQADTGYLLPAPPLGSSDANKPPIDLSESALNDLKNWQGEINLIINRLSKEFLTDKMSHKRDSSNGKYSLAGTNNTNPFTRFNSIRSSTSESDGSEFSDIDPSVRLRKRITAILKFLGINAFKFLKNFSVSLIAILFIIWCFKKNVIVERTFVKEPLSNNRQKKELIINMVLNTDENKWFIRLLNVLNSFVGFV